MKLERKMQNDRMTSFNGTYVQIEQNEVDTKYLEKCHSEVCDTNLQDLGILNFVTPFNMLEKSIVNVNEKVKDYQNQHEELKRRKETLIDIVNLSDKGSKDALDVINNYQSSVEEEIIHLKESKKSKEGTLHMLQNGKLEAKEKIVFDPKIRQELQALKSLFPIVFEESKAGNFHGYILNRERNEARKFLFSETDDRCNVSNNFWKMFGEPSTF